MIACLKGEIIEVTAESALLNVNGVGYELQCSISTLAELQTWQMQKAKAPVFLWTYTHVREDVLQLFGFAQKEEKHLFLSLLKVNGVGPKMAMNIVSGGTVEQIMNLIETEDAKGLSKLPKVGKKTAEQIILTLKGKLVSLETGTAKSSSKNILPVHREISSALVNLGFRPQDVEKVVSDLAKDLDLQEGIRQGLAALSSH